MIKIEGVCWQTGVDQFGERFTKEALEQLVTPRFTSVPVTINFDSNNVIGKARTELVGDKLMFTAVIHEITDLGVDSVRPAYMVHIDDKTNKTTSIQLTELSFCENPEVLPE